MDGVQSQRRDRHRGSRRAGIWVIVAAALAVLFAGASPSAAKETHGKVAINVGQSLAGDGNRFVSFQRADGVPVIMDTWTRKTRRIRGADGCAPADVAFGRVLLDCTRGWYYDYRHPRVAMVKTGESHPIPGTGKTEQYDYGEIGRFWVRGNCDAGGPCNWIVYRNFRTGKSRSFGNVGSSARRGPPGLSVYDFDLNHRHLGKYVPHPAFRLPTRTIESSNYFGFGPRFYLVRSKGYLFMVRDRSRTCLGTIMSGRWSNDYAIHRSSGRFAWVSDRRLHVFEIKSGRKTVRKVKADSAIAIIRDGVIVASPSISGNGARHYLLKLWRL
jgi:hypothetical protein